jgi:anion-transporting  ArsA/GET3 family ATPase
MQIPTNKIHFVMGKGGVGKSTISLLLARYFEQQKESSIIAECNGAQDIPKYYGLESLGYECQTLRPLISSISITAEKAIEEYLIKQLHFQKLYQLLFKNRLVDPLLQGAPGLHNAVHLGKIYDLSILKKQGTARFDHIIVDCPATGHGLRLLSAAQTMMNLTRVGPLYESNRLVEECLQEKADIIMVTLPEELPSKETKYLWTNLNEKQRQKTKLLFVNKYNPDSMPEHVKIPTQWQKVFPTHHQQLEEWTQEHQENLQWQEWLKNEVPLTQVTIPQQELAQATLPISFQQTWEMIK